MTKARWDAWFSLSPSTRKTTDPRRYARGETVGAQRRSAAEVQVIARMLDLKAEASQRTIELGVATMTARELRWTIKAPHTLIRKRARQPVMEGRTRNPWWYN
jgi:hypothetical protein